jgi:hypothetical protein
MARSERITAAQAFVRFRAAQSLERDGEENPFFWYQTGPADAAPRSARRTHRRVTR